MSFGPYGPWANFRLALLDGIWNDAILGSFVGFTVKTDMGRGATVTVTDVMGVSKSISGSDTGVVFANLMLPVKVWLTTGLFAGVNSITIENISYSR
jgi:hypothetical protein